MCAAWALKERMAKLQGVTSCMEDRNVVAARPQHTKHGLKGKHHQLMFFTAAVLLSKWKGAEKTNGGRSHELLEISATA